MTLAKALGYFLREAVLNLFRSWRISFLAVATIGVSLFLGGVFLLAIVNGSRVVEQWKEEAKVVVYLAPGIEPEEAPEVEALIVGRPWVRSVVPVSTGEAKRRFRQTFPSVEDLVASWGPDPLPASFEVSFDLASSSDAGFTGWIETLAGHPRVAAVDDDRDWVRQLETTLRVVSAVGLALGGVLLGAAIFTIASVIRLTAYLYRDEIAVMRLVGATEFFIRGPFYLEGFLQGLLGGLAALGALYLSFQALTPEGATAFLGGALWARFLSWPLQLALVGLGGLAGLLGAVVSLRRERL